MEEDSESIKGDETESMRHAVKLAKGSTSTRRRKRKVETGRDGKTSSRVRI